MKQVQRGHEVTVLTTDAYTQRERLAASEPETTNGIRVVRARNMSVWLRGKANLSTPFGLRRQAHDLLPTVDVVYCHEFRTLENVLLTPLADALDKSLILSPHGTLGYAAGRSTLKSVWDRVLSPRIADRFQHVVGLTSDEVADATKLWVQLGAKSKFHHIPNGVNLTAFENLPDTAAFRARHQLGTRPVLLYMGRLHPRKGVDLLVKAFQRAAVPDLQLVIVGPDDGLLSGLQHLTESDPNTHLLGYFEGNERLMANVRVRGVRTVVTTQGLGKLVGRRVVVIRVAGSVVVVRQELERQGGPQLPECGVRGHAHGARTAVLCGNRPAVVRLFCQGTSA
jgi:glycosyltransferase involved in cell wall biosynthesis